MDQVPRSLGGDLHNPLKHKINDDHKQFIFKLKHRLDGKETGAMQR